MTWVRTRSLVTVPVPWLVPLIVPLMYEGTALPPLLKLVGGGAGVRGANPAASYPSSDPVITFPGVWYPGRPPRIVFHDSQFHATMPPARSRPALRSIAYA